MKTFKVKPQKGLIVRDPETRKPLEESGETKPRDTYWLRRVQDKSVTVMASKKSATNKESEA